ncbi:transporter [Streptomyces sp. NPDC037389]|uniref:transporter n=1 Tax=Streptomyces sp. NPDC037389 TaxID=3155369 RepID=UPI0033E8ED31
MKGTLWPAWRQQRALVAALATLAACAIWVALRRADMTAFIDAHHIPACKGWDPEECSTDAVTVALAQRLIEDNTGAIRLLAAFSAALPVIIGLFWGAPLIGREIETGTVKLALSQGAGLRHWFTARLGLAALCAVVASTALAALVAWWWAPVSNMLDGLYWHDGFLFNATGPAAVACALFGLAVGTAAGALLRRTTPAMGAALAAVAGTRLLLTFVRPDRLEPLRRVTPGAAPKKYVGSAWSTGEFGYLDAAGREFPISRYCRLSGPEMRQCMTEHGFVARYHKVYPSGDLWTLQWIETAIFLGLAAALLVATYAVLRRRLV